MSTDLAVTGFICGMRKAMIGACGGTNRRGRNLGWRFVLLLVSAAAAAASVLPSRRGALAALFRIRRCGLRQVGETGQGFAFIR